MIAHTALFCLVPGVRAGVGHDQGGDGGWGIGVVAAGWV